MRKASRKFSILGSGDMGEELWGKITPNFLRGRRGKQEGVIHTLRSFRD